MQEVNNKPVGADSMIDIGMFDPKTLLFYTNSHGFLCLKVGETDHKRVKLARVLPFSEPYRYISVATMESKEIGILKDVADLPEAQAAIVREELEHRYYCPVVTEILSIKENEFVLAAQSIGAKKGRIIRKQKVAIKMSVSVTEYTTKEYRNRVTGARVHAPFPKGYVNEVNYDGTIKAFAFLLGNECNVSHAKIKKLISEMTNGEVDISVGMINGLCKEFSEKTEAEKAEILKELMLSPVMNADFTNANVNGNSAQVLVLASPMTDAALYIAREKKGHEGVKGTALENYVGILVHDHDRTFYSYGTGHQECIQHNCRYLIGSIQNEPELSWNRKMHELFREMLHYKNGLGKTEDFDKEKVRKYEERYDAILAIAEQEYADAPPGDYYREGYNLFLRLRKYKENELLFLHDKRVPANNSLCERLARVFKRKQKQAITLRSQENLGYICDGLSIVYLLRAKEKSVYDEISQIYERQKPVLTTVNKEDVKA